MGHDGAVFGHGAARGARFELARHVGGLGGDVEGVLVGNVLGQAQVCGGFRRLR